MTKRRYTDDEGCRGPRRVRTPRKQALRLDQGPARPPKPGKAVRAARKRRRRQEVAPAPSPRPPYNDPRWVVLKARVLAAGRCAWCGATRRLTVDHILPLAAGGKSNWHNLQCLCRPCNQAKGDQTGIFPCPT